MQDTRLIIFDCDGVLVNTEAILCQIDATELSRAGFDLSMEQLAERFSGVPAERMFSEIEKEWGRELPDDYRQRRALLIEKAYRNELTAIDGVHHALTLITQPVCVASSNSTSDLELLLTAAGLYSWFSPNIFSATMVAHPKPAPDLFLFAALRMKTIPASCLVIEDSVVGVQAARAAGMRVFAFCGGGHCSPGHGKRLVAHGADAFFSSMRRLPEILRDLARRD